MEDYDKLVKALRCKRDDCEGCDLAFFDKDEGWMCQYAAKDDDAAAAIEALQAQMPKRGEWKKWADKHGMTQLVRLVCSECGKDIVVSKENIPNYCPNCGAKMEVQDGQ